MQGLVIKLVIGLAIVSFISLKIYGLQNDLDIANLKLEASSKTHALDRVKIDSLVQSTTGMADTINRLNKEYKKYKYTANTARKTLAAWRAKADTDKYKQITDKINPDAVDFTNTTCSNGLILNRSIAELKYEDL